MVEKKIGVWKRLSRDSTIAIDFWIASGELKPVLTDVSSHKYPIFGLSLLRTKSRCPEKSHAGLTVNDSRYYGVISWYQNYNFIILTLDKADTMYFSYNRIT